MNNHVETKAIKAVIQNYIVGTSNADIEKLKGVFHEKAVMNGYLGPDCLLADPSGFIADISGAPSMASANDPYQAEIESIHVEGGVASVIVSETGFRGAATLVDFFHLIKQDGKWTIISKLFTTLYAIYYKNWACAAAHAQFSDFVHFIQLLPSCSLIYNHFPQSRC